MPVRGALGDPIFSPDRRRDLHADRRRSQSRTDEEGTMTRTYIAAAALVAIKMTDYGIKPVDDK